jgi:hypothetical protein
MTYAGTLESRVTTNDGADGLEVVLPAPRVWIAIVLLGLWLAGWAAGEVFALRAMLASAPLPARAFLLVWLAFWTLGGAFALAACAWMLAGHERVRLRADALALRREVLGVGPIKAYALDRISNLRAQELPTAVSLKVVPAGTRPAQEQVAALRALVGIRGPGIAFDYEGRPVRFGFALDALEARQVVAQLQARHVFAGGQAAQSGPAPPPRITPLVARSPCRATSARRSFEPSAL